MNGLGRLLKILLAALPLGSCTPATLLNAFVPSDGYVLHEGLSYGDGERQRLDLYQPEDSPGEAPVVVYFYGGSWKSGSRRTYRFLGEALARGGFLVAVPDYRLYPEVRFPTFVADGARVVRWLRAHARDYGGDPERIILMGHSAGAHIAALLAYDESYLAREAVPASALSGFVGLAGPYAFDPLAYRSTRAIFEGLTDPDQARPIAFVDGAVAQPGPPALLLHGADDRTVLPQNSREMAAAIEDSGGRATFREYPDTCHIGIVLSLAAPFRGRDAVYQDTMAFLKSL